MSNDLAQSSGPFSRRSPRRTQFRRADEFFAEKDTVIAPEITLKTRVETGQEGQVPEVPFQSATTIPQRPAAHAQEVFEVSSWQTEREPLAPGLLALFQPAFSG